MSAPRLPQAEQTNAASPEALEPIRRQQRTSGAGENVSKRSSGQPRCNGPLNEITRFSALGRHQVVVQGNPGSLQPQGADRLELIDAANDEDVVLSSEPEIEQRKLFRKPLDTIELNDV